MTGSALTGVGIVVGLEAEAQIARRLGLTVAVGGGNADGAARAADALAPDVTGLISFGLAGGLDPGLVPGAILVPGLVVDGGESWTTDPTLNNALGGATGHAMLGGGQILTTIAEKRAAFAAGMAAVDLESTAVARAAARHNLPFAVLRAVCDPAGRALPQAALVALDGAGRIQGLRIAAAVLRRPLEIPALIALGRDAAAARTALLRRVTALLP